MSGRSPTGAWGALAFESWALAWEASGVIGLRLAKIAGGGSAALGEVSLMASEKVAAAIELQAALATAGMAATPLENARRAVRLYRRKVRSNRRRLTAAVGRSTRTG